MVPSVLVLRSYRIMIFIGSVIVTSFRERRVQRVTKCPHVKILGCELVCNISSKTRPWLLCVVPGTTATTSVYLTLSRHPCNTICYEMEGLGCCASFRERRPLLRPHPPCIGTSSEPRQREKKGFAPSLPERRAASTPKTRCCGEANAETAMYQ